MPISTRLTQQLGIKTPILLAPMAGVSGGRLALAVTEAGGLGFVAGGYLTASDLLDQIDLARGTRIGVGFITWRIHRNRQAFDAVLERKPSAVFLSFGNAKQFVAPIKTSGALLFMQVQSLAMAKEAADLGADVIVVQGTEAGGHGAERALGPLLDEVLSADLGPITIAAGGIGNGNALAASIVRGASGALLGTAFYAAEESLAHPAAKLHAVSICGDDTERSDLFDTARGLEWPQEWTLRSAKNTFSRKWRTGRRYLCASSTTKDAFARASIEGDFETAPVIIGEGAGLICSQEPASTILTRIEREAMFALRRAPHSLC